MLITIITGRGPAEFPNVHLFNTMEKWNSEIMVNKKEQGTDT